MKYFYKSDIWRYIQQLIQDNRDRDLINRFPTEF